MPGHPRRQHKQNLSKKPAAAVVKKHSKSQGSQVVVAHDHNYLSTDGPTAVAGATAALAAVAITDEPMTMMADPPTTGKTRSFKDKIASTIPALCETLQLEQRLTRLSARKEILLASNKAFAEANKLSSGSGSGGSGDPTHISPGEKQQANPGRTRSSVYEPVAEATNATISELLTILFMAKKENEQLEKELEEKQNFLRNLKALNKNVLVGKSSSSSKRSKAKRIKEKQTYGGDGLAEAQLFEIVTEKRGAGALADGTGAGTGGSSVDVVVDPATQKLLDVLVEAEEGQRPSRSCRSVYRKDKVLQKPEEAKGKEAADDVGGGRRNPEIEVIDLTDDVESVTRNMAELVVVEEGGQGQQRPPRRSRSRSRRNSVTLGFSRRRSRSMTRTSPDITIGSKF